jgi:hypothetical protein
MLKQCGICKNIKDILEFHKHSHHSDGHSSTCKECQNLYLKAYRKINKEKIAIKRNKNKEITKKKSKIYYKLYPWKRTLIHIKQRCDNKNAKIFKQYGAKGIKNLITEEELKELWFRDKAYEMKEPSIDRIDSDGNYEFSNCQYLEKLKNSIKGSALIKREILQFDLNNNFIKEWDSITNASKSLNILHTNIGSVLRKITHSAGGYIWRYKSVK